MTREIEWVEFTCEDKNVIAIGHDPHMLDDTLWFRIEFEKDGIKVKAEIPLSACDVRVHLNRWFPVTQSVKREPESVTPEQPQK